MDTGRLARTASPLTPHPPHPLYRYYVFLQHNEAEPGTWTGASKSYGADNDVVQVLLCNPSAAVAAAGMTKLFVIRSMKTGKVLATTCFLRNAQQKSQHWPAVAKRVALGFDSHVNYIELDPAIDKQLGWLVTRLTYPAQNLWQADGTQISKPPGGATRIWVETRENMPPHDQSHVLPPEMHAYFANGTMGTRRGRTAGQRAAHASSSSSSHPAPPPLPLQPSAAPNTTARRASRSRCRPTV